MGFDYTVDQGDVDFYAVFGLLFSATLDHIPLVFNEFVFNSADILENH